MATVVGQVLNERYEILEKVGEGGMAIAYRGRDRLLGRTVAVKIMRVELAVDAEFLGRFRREARAAAGITHEHIAAVYDTGSEGSYHYIVMEYVEGESLRDRLRREGPLPLGEALQIAAETAEALAAAHAAGVVHRDIKPHNILLSQEGKVKVTDFGIARAATAGVAQGDTSLLVGSVNYMSPEQARGEAVGPQADIYSLGATLFEMLTGKPPFEGGDRLAILHKHVYDRPPKPSEFRPGLPPEVDSVVGHCLEKDQGERYASAREALNYLNACPRVEEPGLGVIGRGRRGAAVARGAMSAGSWMRRRGVWLALGIMLIFGTVAVLTYMASARGREQMLMAPDILGMSAGAAEELLEQLGLGYRQVGTRASEDMPEGAVLSQDPAAGLIVAPDTVVKVVVSEGPSHVVVPEVTQMSLSQAQRNLELAGLVAGAVQQAYDENVPAGYVASTLPAFGARVASGTSVDIVLSLGREPAALVGASIPTPLPTDSGREETLTYVVPSGEGTGELEVIIEVIDEEGRRKIYEGRHRAGERIPPQRIKVTSPTTARIMVEGRLRAERRYLP